MFSICSSARLSAAEDVFPSFCPSVFWLSVVSSFVCLLVCRSVCLPVYLYVRLSVLLSVRLYVCLSVSVSAFPLVCLLVRRPDC